MNNRPINARCMFIPSIVARCMGMSYDDKGNLVMNYEVGRMNRKNLKIIVDYLEKKGYDCVNVRNDSCFGTEVVRIEINENRAEYLPGDFDISCRDFFFVSSQIVYVKNRAFFKYINDDGVLEFEKPFDLMDYEFEQRFATLNPIRRQLRENGIRVDNIDIWDDYLMIKSDFTEHSLNMSAIMKALNINDNYAVRNVEPNKCYAVRRWK